MRPVSYEARPWLFLGVTLAVTWLLGLTAALTGESGVDWWATALHYASGAVPLVVAVILLLRVHKPVRAGDDDESWAVRSRTGHLVDDGYAYRVRAMRLRTSRAATNRVVRSGAAVARIATMVWR